jgi:hypothetical protein
MAAAAPPVLYKVYLSEAGNPIPEGSDAPRRFLVTITDIPGAFKHEVDAERRSLAHGSDHWCMGTISPEYIAYQVDKLDFVMKLYTVNDRSEATSQIGFVLLIDQGDDTLYIDVICAKTTPHSKRVTGMDRIRAGKMMLNQVETFAQLRGVTRLRLSSLAYVIGYYERFGFKMQARDSPHLREAVRGVTATQFRSDEEFEMAYLVGYATHLAYGTTNSFDPMTMAKLRRMAIELRHLFLHWSEDDDKPFQFVAMPAHATTPAHTIRVFGGTTKQRKTLQQLLDNAVTHPDEAARIVRSVIGLRREGVSKADPRRGVQMRHAVARSDEGRAEVAAAGHGFLMIKPVSPMTAGEEAVITSAMAAAKAGGAPFMGVGGRKTRRRRTRKRTQTRRVRHRRYHGNRRHTRHRRRN